MGKQWLTLFLGAPKSLQMVTAAMKLRYSWKESYDQPRQHIKKQRHYSANKGPSSQSYGFSSSHVWMWELDYKESWMPKNWCFWTVVLEKILKSPLETLKRVPGKSNQSILREIIPEYSLEGLFDAKAETLILWPLDAKNWLIWKARDAGNDWRWEKKGMTEDDIVGWLHRCNGHEFE